MQKFIIILVTVTLMCNCSSYYLKANYDFKNVEMYRNEQVKKTYAVLLFNGYDYEDSLISVKFEPLPNYIALKVKNNQQKSISIEWDNGSFVDLNGQSHRIVYSSIPVLDKEKEQQPTIVPAHSYVTENIVCWDYIDWDESDGEIFDDWYFARPLFDARIKNKDDLEPYINKHKGSGFKVLLPIRCNNELIEYLFTFQLTYFEKSKLNRVKGVYETF